MSNKPKVSVILTSAYQMHVSMIMTGRSEEFKLMINRDADMIRTTTVFSGRKEPAINTIVGEGPYISALLNKSMGLNHHDMKILLIYFNTCKADKKAPLKS